MKQGPKMEMMYFQDFTYQEVEKTKKMLKDKWLGDILDIYKVGLYVTNCLLQCYIQYLPHYFRKGNSEKLALIYDYYQNLDMH